MLYLAGQILLYLALAALVGGAVGWMLATRRDQSVLADQTLQLRRKLETAESQLQQLRGEEADEVLEQLPLDAPNEREEFESALRERDEQAQQLTSELERVHAQRDDLERSREESESERNELLNRLAGLEQELQETKTATALHETKSAEEVERALRLSDSLREAQSQIEEHEARRASVEEDLRDSQRELDELRSALEGANLELAARGQRIREHEERLGQSDDDQVELELLRERVDELEQAASEGGQREAAERESSEQTQAELERFRTVADERSREVEELAAQAHDASQRHEELERALDHQRVETQAADQRIDTLKAQLEAIEEEKRSLAEQLEQSDDHKGALEEQIQKAHDENRRRFGDLDRAQGELERELSEKNEQIERLLALEQENGQEQLELQSRLEQRESELESLRGDLDAAYLAVGERDQKLREQAEALEARANSEVAIETAPIDAIPLRPAPTHSPEVREPSPTPSERPPATFTEAAASQPEERVYPQPMPARPKKRPALRGALQLPGALETPPEHFDDLKRISGIGPKLEGLLNQLGIYHYQQIARWTPEEVVEVDEHLRVFRGRIARDRWVQQAQAIMGSKASGPVSRP